MASIIVIMNILCYYFLKKHNFRTNDSKKLFLRIRYIRGKRLISIRNIDLILWNFTILPS